MLEGFKDLKDWQTFNIAKSRMLIIHGKLLKGKSLTQKDEDNLKLLLWADIGPGRTFRDDDHRLQLIGQWWRDAELHVKSLKEKEKKAEE